MSRAERECRACAVVVMCAAYLRSDNGRYQQSADEEDYHSHSRLYLVRKLPNGFNFVICCYW